MSVSQSTRSYKNRGVPKPSDTHEKDSQHDQNTQATQPEVNPENSNLLLTEGGDHTKVAADIIKRCRFKRRALKCIIERYTYATKQLMARCCICAGGHAFANEQTIVFEQQALTY